MIYRIKQKLRKIVPYNIILLTHKARAVLAVVMYSSPKRKIRVIGVAGTKGKTTTTNMIAKVLEGGGHKVAMLSTANFQIGEEKWLNDKKLTSTTSFYLQKFLKKAVKAKCDYAIVEISSHGLVQFRHWGVKYKTVVLTNMMSDHLDYHKTYENYKNSHNALLTKDLENIIINYDDENLRSFLNFDGPKKYIFSLKGYKEIENVKLIKAGDIVSQKQGLNFSVKTDKGNMPVQLPLIGEFNIYNSLAATAVGLAENIKPLAIKKALESVKNIPGRLEKIQEGQDFEVIVDYAHSPDSLRNVYSAVKPIVQKRMIAVLGGTGDRDKTYRAKGGELADMYADVVIVTNEDPYSEDPEEIINQVVDGVNNKIFGETFFRISDRKEAIQKAINLAEKDDLVIITGKGAEQFMVCGEEKIPWDDREIVREALKNRIK